MDRTTARCPNCGGSRYANVLAEEELKVEGDVFEAAWTLTKYRILSCRGCGTRFFQTVSINPDDMLEQRDASGEELVGLVHRETIKYYPSFTHRKRPDWSTIEWTQHQKLRDITDEMYSALDNELPVLAAIGMRTVLDAATEVLGIDPGGTFSEKLDAILSLGKISQEERKHLVDQI